MTPIKTNRLCWVLGIPCNFCGFFCDLCCSRIHSWISAKSSSEAYKSLVSWWPHKINCSEAVMEKPQLLGSTWIGKVIRNIQGKAYMTLSSYEISFQWFLSQPHAWVVNLCLGSLLASAFAYTPLQSQSILVWLLIADYIDVQIHHLLFSKETYPWCVLILSSDGYKKFCAILQISFKDPVCISLK